MPRPGAVLIAVILLLAAPTAQSDWNTPFEPFTISGNLHYVGTAGLGAYLFTSPEGHVLVDGALPDGAPLILRSIERLGFRPADVKWLLTTQAHFDHVGSLAAVARATGARVAVMQGDAELVERGGRGDFAFGDSMTFPAVTVDRVLKDGDTVVVGPTTLSAVHTPGHTRGSTTWTTTVPGSAGVLRVVIAASLSVNPPVRLLSRPSYPDIAEGYTRTIARLRALQPDIFLAAHTQFFDLTGKRDRLAGGGQINPFVDPAGFRGYIDEWEAQFKARLEQERNAAASPGD